MRVRPFFWLVLLLSCMSVLAAAIVYQPHVRATLEVHINPTPVLSTREASVELRLTDPAGLPIDQAQVIPTAHMTNMEMYANPARIRALGNGCYMIHVLLYMSGPWAITIQAHAQGFDPQQSTQIVHVT